MATKTSEAALLYLNESSLQTIEAAPKFTIFGYIREHQNKYEFNVIPKLITLIILAYYLDVIDTFDPDLCGKFIEISNDNKTIKSIVSGQTFIIQGQTCYGKKIIPSTSIGTFIWKIKLIKGKAPILIGIDNAQKADYNKIISRNQSRGCYAYWCKGGYFNSWKADFEYGFPRFVKQGDILTIKLDLTSNGGKLIYKINNNKEFSPYNDILREKGLDYQFAISMYETDVRIELLS